jgi:hypothetical protein
LEVAASLKAYTNYTQLSPMQEKKTITKEMKDSIGKSTKQGSRIERKRRKFTSQPESGGSSCQLSIMAQKYQKDQEEKF